MSNSNSQQLPLVSAVIPTRNRPELVCRAVRSVLEQTYPLIEAVVIIDGPDTSTAQALEAMRDARIRIITLCENVGGSEARNIGIQNAHGEWIALLDDDDEWIPHKISTQIQTMLSSQSSMPIGTCLTVARRKECDEIIPRRIISDTEDLSEYLICRRTPTYGDGSIQTSTIVARKSFFLEVPFTKGLPKHQDWDWLLRASTRRDAKIEWDLRPLCVFYMDSGRKRVSSDLAWKYTLQWAAENPHITRRSVAYLIALYVVPSMSLRRDFRFLPQVLAFWMRYGSFEPYAAVLGLIHILLPIAILKSLKAFLFARK